MTDAPITLSKLAPLPVDAYYESLHGRYWILDSDGNWMSIDTTSLKMRLALLGYDLKASKNDAISPADAQVLRIQNERSVNYVGPLAGYKRGLYLTSGFKVLVTHSPAPLVPTPGEWPLLDGILTKMFGAEQLTYFHAWVQLSHLSVSTGQHTLGCALVMAGPPNCGKSLLQFLITVIIGGRSAKPYRYMMANTQFNRELFGAEHLMIEDEVASTDLRGRRAFGAAIKQIVATREHSCHGKGREAFMLYPFWRLTISLNDEPENVAILPPIEDSIEEKLIVLKAAKHNMPMPTDTPAGEALLKAALLAELPHYLDWLVNVFVVPGDWRAPRYGVAGYIHPELLTILDGLSPQARALYIIDHAVFNVPGRTTFTCTADELQHILFQSDYSYQAKQILTYPSAMGSYLGMLAKSKPGRVTKLNRVDDIQQWQITRGAGHVTQLESPILDVKCNLN